MLTMLCEAYTYSESPSSIVSTTTMDYDGLLICDGSQTDGIKPAIYDAKLGSENGSYFITSVTYQSTKKTESIVNFTSKNGIIEVAPAIEVPANLKPTAITKVNGINTSYAPNEEIDLSKISAEITFEGGITKQVSSDKLDITITGSNGLSYKGLKKAFGMPANVTVAKINVSYRQTLDSANVVTSSDLTITRNGSSLAPIIMQDASNVQKSKRARAISSSSLSGFKEDSNFIYTVGNQNEFYYKPIILGLNTSGEQVKLDNDIAYTLANIEGQNNTITSFKENLDKANYLDFTGIDEGTYILTATSSDVSPLQLKIKVIDAYNVYNQKDLAKFDNTTNGNHYLSNKSEDVKDVSIFGTLIGTSNNPTDTANEYKGIVLQDDIKLYPNLLPSNAFDTDNPAFLKKGIHLYSRALKKLDNNALNSFTFEGNYYSIDASQLPLYKQPQDKYADQPILFTIKRYVVDNLYDNETNDQFIMQHMSLIGNAPKSSNTDYWGGMTLVQNRAALDCQLNYVNARRSFIVIETVNNSGGAKINGCKFYDSFNSAIFNDGCGRVGHRAREVVNKGGVSKAYVGETNAINAGIIVDNSELVSAGGPLVISTIMCNKDQVDLPAISYPTVSFTDCVLTSLAKGAEAYYNMLKVLLLQMGMNGNPIEMILANDSNIQGVSGLGGKTKSLQNSNEMFNCISAIINTNSGFFPLNSGYETTYPLTNLFVNYCESDISINNHKYVSYNQNESGARTDYEVMGGLTSGYLGLIESDDSSDRYLLTKDSSKITNLTGTSPYDNLIKPDNKYLGIEMNQLLGAVFELFDK